MTAIHVKPCAFESVACLQLTFTPTWGKRDPGSAAASLAAATAAGGGGNPQMIPSSVYATSENNCKASMDSMLIIYRLIQVSGV